MFASAPEPNGPSRCSDPRAVFVYGYHPLDFGELNTGGGAAIVFNDREEDLITACGMHRVRAIIWRLDPMFTGSHGIPRRLIAALKGVQLLVTATASRRALRELWALADSYASWHVTFGNVDDTGTDLRSFLNGQFPPQAYPAVIAGLAPNVDPAIRDVVAAALILGRRRIDARHLAATLGAPLRTVQHRLQAANTPSIRELLSFALVAQVAFELEILGRSPKHVAADAGFVGPSGIAALSQLVFRRTGRRIGQLSHDGGFDAVVQRLGGLFRSAGSQ